MKRNIRHIRAGNNEWVRVHRDPPPSISDNDWLWELLFKVGGGILLLYIACQIISAMMPFLAVGAVGWFALKVFGKCR